MTMKRTKIDNLIETTVGKVARRNASSYFHKSAVVNEVMNHKDLGRVLADSRRRYGGWEIDHLIMRYIDNRAGRILQQRDANGVRVYECYPTYGLAPDRERRWQILRAMNLTSLRQVMGETRVQARLLEIKGQGYEFFVEELEKLPATATIDEVYENAVPKIRALHKSGGRKAQADTFFDDLLSE